MRKIKVFAHISLDGVISPGDEDTDYSNGGWTASYRTPEGAAAVAEAQGTNFDLLLGRRTYDLWAGFWPKAPSSPFADRLNAATKYVATDRPEGLEWGPVVNLGEDVAEGIRDLKASDGPDLVVWGSTSVTSLLFREGLVDEVVLMVIPVLLGRGKRFFSGDPRGLALISSQTTPSGVLVNHYRYVGPAQPA
jgi:dihydrofolate reductase